MDPVSQKGNPMQDKSARLADSHYDEGVQLAQAHREDEALAAWQRALTANPTHLDALYNIGQLQYGRGHCVEALANWQAALAQSPGDFDLHKKVIQAHNALGQYAEARAGQVALRQLWESSSDPEIKDLFEYVLAQFPVPAPMGTFRAMAFETLRPRNLDLYYAYTFRVLDENGESVMSVQLESSAYGREHDVPYLVGMTMTKSRAHRTVGPAFSVLPTYEELKPYAVRIIEDTLQAGT
jgi:tetratricopeptide (TPR) repeat protein